MPIFSTSVCQNISPTYSESSMGQAKVRMYNEKDLQKNIPLVNQAFLVKHIQFFEQKKCSLHASMLSRSNLLYNNAASMYPRQKVETIQIFYKDIILGVQLCCAIISFGCERLLMTSYVLNDPLMAARRDFILLGLLGERGS